MKQKYELDFLTPDGGSIMFDLSVEMSPDRKTIERQFQKKMAPILKNHYLNLLLKHYSHEELYYVYTHGFDVPRDELENIIWNSDKPKYKCLYLTKI